MVVARGGLKHLLQIDLNPEKSEDVSAAPVHFTFSINQFDITPYQPLLKLPEGMTLDTATLDSTLNVVFADRGRNIDVDGSVGLTGITGSYMDTTIPETDYTIQLDAAVNGLSRLERALIREPDKTGRLILTGDVDFDTGAGTIATDIQDIDLMMFKKLIAGNIERGIVRGKTTTSFSDNFENIQSSGNLYIDNLTARMQENEINDLNIASTYAISTNENGTIDITNFEYVLSTAQQQIGSINIQGMLNSIAGNGRLELEATNVNESLLEAIKPAAHINVEDSSFDMNYSGTVEFEQQFEKIKSAGNLHVKNLRISNAPSGNEQLFPLDIVLAHDVTINSDEIDIASLSLDATPSNESRGLVAGNTETAQRVLVLDGMVNTTKGEGSLNLVITNLKEPLLNAFAKSVREDIEIQSADINATQNLKFSNNFAELSSTGDYSFENIKIRNTATGKPMIAPLTLTSTHTLDKTADTLILKDFITDIIPEEGDKEKLTANAEIHLNGTRKSSFTIYSDQLSLDYFLPAAAGDALGEHEKQKSIENSKRGTSNATPSAVEELEPVDFGGMVLEGAIDIKTIKYQDVVINDFLVSTNVADNLIQISPFSMKMNEGTINVNGTVKVDVPGWDYDATGRVDALELEPLFQTFAPEEKIYIAGTATMDINVTGSGIRHDNLNRNLDGKITGTIKDGVLKGLPVLNALARITRIKVLERLVFFKAETDIDIGDGKFMVNKIDAAGDLYKLGASGWVGFDDNINLLFNLALAPVLSKEVRKLEYVGDILTDEDGYTEFPSPIKMTGTFSNPKPAFAIKEVFEGTGKKVLENLFRKGIEQYMERQD